MPDEGTIRVLEGLGYVSAFMIAVGGVTDLEVLRYFNVIGLFFAIIVLIRLTTAVARESERVPEEPKASPLPGQASQSVKDVSQPNL